MSKKKASTARREARSAPPLGSARCEGWRRTGIFQMGGTGRWEQCKADAIVNLKFKDTQEGGKGKVKILPACKECWSETLGAGIAIIEACPIATNDKLTEAAVSGSQQHK
jgi:hypothetical protein